MLSKRASGLTKYSNNILTSKITYALCSFAMIQDDLYEI